VPLVRPVARNISRQARRSMGKIVGDRAESEKSRAGGKSSVFSRKLLAKRAMAGRILPVDRGRSTAQRASRLRTTPASGRRKSGDFPVRRSRWPWGKNVAGLYIEGEEEIPTEPNLLLNQSATEAVAPQLAWGGKRVNESPTS
jgi:hypothetical protein